jgi:hypothetical protein
MPDLLFGLTGFATSAAPVLPDPVLMRWSLHGIWSLVLGAAVMGLTRRLGPTWRWSLTLLVMGWTLLPGPISPAQWLGLAFQSPSLMSATVCLWYLLRVMGFPRKSPVAKVSEPQRSFAWPALGVASSLLGWILLLDTFAWWPGSVYAWGFGLGALASLTLLVAMMWIVWGQGAEQREACLAAALVLTVYVLTRLPSGNVWDALIDPWLWVMVQGYWLVRWLRR